MTDLVSSQTRSRIMASVRRRDTRPELVIRHSLHRLGFRFRVSDRSLPGSPDIKLSRYRTVIFVNGCFWHRHNGCRYATLPASNREWWVEKFAQNVARDRRKIQQIRKAGWRVMVVWECAVRDPGRVRDRAIRRLVEWIRSDVSSGAIPRRPPATARDPVVHFRE